MAFIFTYTIFLLSSTPRAFQGSRAATDPHWLHALGLTLVLLAMVLAGFLVLVVGLVVALPVATCTLTAAYQQLFGAGQGTGWRDNSG